MKPIYDLEIFDRLVVIHSNEKIRYEDHVKFKQITDMLNHPEDYRIYMRSRTCIIPKIEEVIFNDPATIVFWADDTKTVVKCAEYEKYDAEKGLAMAISKKIYGNKGNYYNEFKKWLPDKLTPGI